MKKILITSAMLLVSAFAMNAQKQTVKDDFTDLFEEKDKKLETLPGKDSKCSVFSPFIFGIGMINSNSLSPFSFNTKKSLDVFFYDMYINHIAGNFYWSHGHGLEWKNLTMTGDFGMIKDSDNQIVTKNFSGDDTFKLSRLRVFSYSIPMLITYDLHNDSGISIGPVINANISSCINTKYHGIDKDKYKNVYERRVTVDLMADLTLEDVHFWIKYCPMDMMKKDHGWPDFQTISFGLAW